MKMKRVGWLLLLRQDLAPRVCSLAEFSNGLTPPRFFVWRGQTGTLQALQDMEQSLPFALLGLDSDNGGEIINHRVMKWLLQQPRPVFMTRSRPYKSDDNAHVELKNWTHVRQCFGYDRYGHPELVGPINELLKGLMGSCGTIFTRV